MKPTIFVVEDEADIARLIRHHLEAAGFFVRHFIGSPGVIADAEKEKPALFLLDIMIPGSDGFELCRRIRQSPIVAMTPVIFLTAKTAESDRVLGFELGADDYITKPFSPRELVARVKAVLRRFERPLAPSVLHAGEIEIDSGAMILTVRGQQVATTATEFRLLEYLAAIPAASSLATNYSMQFGGIQRLLRPVRSMFMCGVSAKKSNQMPTNRVIFVPSAVLDTGSRQ